MFRGHYLILICWLWAGTSLYTGCSDAPSGDVVAPRDVSASELRALAWADSTLATMDTRQKAAQLIWVAAPTDLDSAGRVAFSDSMAVHGFGGLLLDVGQRDSMRLLSAVCLAHARLPIWVALDAGPAWSAAQGWPALLSLGTVASDSLANRWGQALAAECQFLGAQICMVSAGKVAAKSSWTPDALSAAPQVVARLSDALVAGIADADVMVCARPLRDAHDAPALDSLGKRVMYAETLAELDLAAAMPLQRLLKDHPGMWLQATTAAYAAIDTLPIARSGRALGFFLRKKLGFGGLVLSPRGGDVGHLQAGADVLVAPRDPIGMVSAIMAAVQDGRLREAWLDSTVRGQLLAKARRDMYRQTSQALTDIDPYRSLLRMDRLIGKATMVVLRDTKGRLPLAAGIAGKRIATVAYGLGHVTEMQVAMEVYAAMDHFVLGAKSDTAALGKQVERLKKYDYVIVSLHEALTQDSTNGRLAQRAVNFLQRLDRSTRLVVVDFAGRNSLEDLRDLSCLAFVSEDRDRNASLAGQALMGAFPVTALLPDDISPSFTAGMGKVLPRKLRLEYTDPSDFGIPPAAMLRIDSLLEDAIKKQIFPGCQVFAAKDGRVFLQKAYGYHDYEHRLRVRNDHLYDIASVSKIAATTLMAMGAYDLDTLRLDQPLKYFMPDLDSSFVTIKDITPQQLLTHTAGLPAGIVLNRFFRMVNATDSIRDKIYSNAPDSLHNVRIAEDLFLAPSYRDTVWERVRRIYVAPPGNYEYSDLSMYLMKALLERILDEPIERYVNAHYYAPMGLRRICYKPRDRFEPEEIVPTAHDKHWRKQVLQGYVHDPTVAFLGGVGGPAGIFSNSNDLATIMQMLLNGGSYGGQQFFDPETVELFTRRQEGSHRGLGFDKQLRVPSCEKGYCCFSADPETFGHFGFTGTCAWADPQHQLVYVFLSNRVYPDDDNKKINVYRIRQGVQQLIYDALGLGLVPMDDLDCYPN